MDFIGKIYTRLLMPVQILIHNGMYEDPFWVIEGAIRGGYPVDRWWVMEQNWVRTHDPEHNSVGGSELHYKHLFIKSQKLYQVTYFSDHSIELPSIGYLFSLFFIDLVFRTDSFRKQFDQFLCQWLVGYFCRCRVFLVKHELLSYNRSKRNHSWQWMCPSPNHMRRDNVVFRLGDDQFIFAVERKRNEANCGRFTKCPCFGSHHQWRAFK